MFSSQVCIIQCMTATVVHSPSRVDRCCGGAFIVIPELESGDCSRSSRGTYTKPQHSTPYPTGKATNGAVPVVLCGAQPHCNPLPYHLTSPNVGISMYLTHYPPSCRRRSGYWVGTCHWVHYLEFEAPTGVDNPASPPLISKRCFFAGPPRIH
jgi:hypothetical protein